MKNEGKTHCQFSVLGFPVLRLRAKTALGRYSIDAPTTSLHQALRQFHEGGFEVDLFFAEQRQLEAALK